MTAARHPPAPRCGRWNRRHASRTRASPRARSSPSSTRRPSRRSGLQAGRSRASAAPRSPTRRSARATSTSTRSTPARPTSVILGKTDAPTAAAGLRRRSRPRTPGRGLTTLTPSAVQQRQPRRLHPGGRRQVRPEDAVGPRQGVAEPHVLGQPRAPHPRRRPAAAEERSTAWTSRTSRSSRINLRYKPIEDGQAQCVYAFGTDPQIASRRPGAAGRTTRASSRAWRTRTSRSINTAFFDAQPPVFAETLDKVDAAAHRRRPSPS